MKGARIEDLATGAAANWTRFESVAWHERPDDPENWAIVYTSSRDSTLIEKSNEAAITSIMEPFTETLKMMQML